MEKIGHCQLCGGCQRAVRLYHAGTKLDLWNDKCYVSLVGFMFQNTRLLGIKIPFHVYFEEVNLRFYVKRFDNGIWKRGVVFIKEIVPKRALTFVANTVYNENYETLPMSHVWQEAETGNTIKYSWTKQGFENSILVKSRSNSLEIEPDSETEFITEHYWGYAKVNNQKTNEYEVTHPKWKVYDVMDYAIHVDFGLVYGKQFQFLNHLNPISVMLAEGSEISVKGKRILEV
ncbi:MAG: DUF2071 domain-containing protein [Bacteroidia bacterium]